MSIHKIKEITNKNKGILTAKEVSENNIASWYLTDMVKKGHLERISRGIYFDSNYDNYDELYFFQLQNKACIYSYQTALYLYGLTDRIPFKHEVTVVQGYNAWRMKDKVFVHQIKKEWHNIGVTEVVTEMGNIVRVYDMERSICDLVRDRKNQDIEIFSKAWHLFLKKREKNIWKLREYAKILGVSKQIEDILEVMVYE